MNPLNDRQRISRIYAQLMDWFSRHKRDLPWRSNPREAYKVWISEIMLQQTQVETVIPYFEAWMARWPDIQSLSRASEDQVLKAWEGLGYYARARNILKTACLLTEENEAHLPKRYQELLKLPGIGPYTAAAIASYSFGQAIGAVDANVLRVISRLNQEEWTAGDPKSLRDCQKYLTSVMEYLKQSKTDGGQDFQPGPLNESLIELGALVCQAKSFACKLCPLRKDCLAATYDSVSSFPLPKEQVVKKEEYYNLLILYHKDLHIFAVEQRPSEGLLGGLWQFPLLEGTREPAEIRDYLEDKGLQVLALHQLQSYRHIFSHLVWNIRPYVAVISDRAGVNQVAAEQFILGETPDPVRWFTAETLMDLPFSSSMTRLRDLVVRQAFYLD